jgi:hypothetical protein
MFVSDSGILFSTRGTTSEKLSNLLNCLKEINQKMLERNYMLTTSIAFGEFSYQGKIEFLGIEKNPIYGFAYVEAYLDNANGSPKIQPGQCRLIKSNQINDIDLSAFPLLKKQNERDKHLYYYWNLNNPNDISLFEKDYNDTYKLRFAGILEALKKNY